eukprot:2342295-Amphidinium_carterae.1
MGPIVDTRRAAVWDSMGGVRCCGADSAATILKPQSDSDISRLSNLAGITMTAHHMCRREEYNGQRHPNVLACRKWHLRH